MERILRAIGPKATIVGSSLSKARGPFKARGVLCEDGARRVVELNAASHVDRARRGRASIQGQKVSGSIEILPGNADLIFLRAND